MMPENIVPYVGPRPFDRSDGKVFFGREKEIRQIVNLILTNSIVVLYSKSGSGKSSLLNAGVIPRLESEELEILGPVRIAGRASQNIKNLENIFIFNAISSLLDDQPDVQKFGKKTLMDYLDERVSKLNKVGQPLARVIIFDQFEELFTQYPEYWNKRENFFKQIQDALEQDNLLRIVLSIREDYLGEIEPYLSLLRNKLQAHFRLEAMRWENALEAVKGPLGAIDKTFAPGIAEMIVNNLMTTRYTTPDGGYSEGLGEFIEPVQLQVVCQSLWQDLPSKLKIITSEHIKAFSNVVEKNLSNLYDESIQRTILKTGISEKLLREWFEKSLISPSKTRLTVLRGSDDTAGIPNDVVDKLENQHIIRAEFRAGARWYELTHDTLINPIIESNRKYRSIEKR